MRYSDLSRVVSHALRHEPWLYELELDDAGWVPVDELLAVMRDERPAWVGLSETDLVQMIEHSGKQRHELRDGKIRALYGHSTVQKLAKEHAQPPDVLFHGTSPQNGRRIREEGLKPMARQYVHLSVDPPTAEQVGRRKAREPVLLRIDALRAHRDGVPFYMGNEHVWLANEVPPQYIS